MAIQTTANLTNSVRTQYLEQYLQAAQLQRVYDMFASPIGKDMAQLEKGTAVQVDFLSDMAPGTSTISQTADITPQTLRDASATITATTRGEALQWSMQLNIQVYTDYTAGCYRALGKNQMESVDLLAQAAVLQGNNLFRQTATRVLLAPGTAAHRLSEAVLGEMGVLIQTLKCPPLVMAEGKVKQLMAVFHPHAYYDLRTATAILSVGAYQDKSIILNWELGTLGPFRLLVTPWAKVFGASGSANASAVATTLNGAVNALATTVILTSATNITAGDYITIGTIETGNTFQPINERVRVSAAYVSGTTVNIIGEGANGGLRFDHATGAGVSNANSVYPVAIGSPMSAAKVYATELGEFGEVVGPQQLGILKQFNTLGWRYLGNYGLWGDNYILRGEFSSSLEA